ncbi:hypothetical protein, conserved [Babesia bigemina]|uniref:Uncharacterized protein n=1 Tax=Babesia bigemina TaxID=5866 RepID=A0A061DBR8_BABBI|nr:hypothetical protein, conserved [Babesia bigemina]CDR97407.1 hypothetical protein, conserved [Babesia bigemina]|eukprot:XP_012769593.1 hypothetical protein, conserved [Babesia bigemina]
MESDRSGLGPGNQRQGSRSKSAQQDAAASKRSTERPSRDRQMVPFFGNGEIDNTACVALKKGTAGQTRRSRRSRMPSAQDTPFSTPNGREVGISALPIGQSPLDTTQGHPINVDLAHLKNVGVSVSSNATIVDLSDKMSDYKTDDRDSEQLGSTCTMSSSVETLCCHDYDESCNELADPSGPYADAVGTLPHYGRAGRCCDASPTVQEKARQLVNMLYTSTKKDAHARKNVPSPGKSKPKAGKETGYVLPRYLCSPDPSSIPLPGRS